MIICRGEVISDEPLYATDNADFEGKVQNFIQQAQTIPQLMQTIDATIQRYRAAEATDRLEAEAALQAAQVADQWAQFDAVRAEHAQIQAELALEAADVQALSPFAFFSNDVDGRTCPVWQRKGLIPR